MTLRNLESGTAIDSEVQKKKIFLIPRLQKYASLSSYSFLFINTYYQQMGDIDQ